MYRRIIARHIMRSLVENVHISEKVDRQKTAVRGTTDSVSIGESVSAVKNADKRD
jgi:hypothetical protein